MNSWKFYPMLATKEAFDNRIFDNALDLRKVLKTMDDSTLPITGQILLKGKKESYPKHTILFESHDGSGVYIEYDTLLDLKEILKTIHFKEELVERIIIYKHGFFIK